MPQQWKLPPLHEVAAEGSVAAAAADANLAVAGGTGAAGPASKLKSAARVGATALPYLGAALAADQATGVNSGSFDVNQSGWAHTFFGRAADLFTGHAAGGIAGRTGTGMLWGPGTGTSDSILGIGANGMPTAFVSTGEGIVKTAAMQRPGVAQMVAGLNGYAGGTDTSGVTGPQGQPGYYSPADPRKVREAEQKVADAETRVRELEVKQSELKANAKESERLRLLDELDRAKREVRDARADLATAQQGKFTQSRSGGPGSTPNFAFAPLAQDFGISGGLPGVAQWLTTLLGNMAVASIMGPLTGLGPGDIPGFGLQESQQNRATQQSTPSSSDKGMSGMPVGLRNATALAKSASGRKYGFGGTGGPGAGGLYDCSGYMSSIYGTLTGQSMDGSQRFFTTESDFSKLGFEKGFDPNSAFNIGVHHGGPGGGHMAGTLNGVNVESGGPTSTTQCGGPAAGALNPQFENHWHLPNSAIAGASSAAATPAYSAPTAATPVTGSSDSILQSLEQQFLGGGGQGVAADIARAQYAQYSAGHGR